MLIKQQITAITYRQINDWASGIRWLLDVVFYIFRFLIATCNFIELIYSGLYHRYSKNVQINVKPFLWHVTNSITLHATLEETRDPSVDSIASTFSDTW